MNSRQQHHAPARVRSYALFAILRNRHRDWDFDRVMEEVDAWLVAEERAAFEKAAWDEAVAEHDAIVRRIGIV